MTEFKSVYKVLESLNNKNWTRVDQMASVLELEGAMTIDRYGRLNIATVDEVNKVLEELAYYYHEVPPFDNSFKRTFEHSDSDIQTQIFRFRFRIRFRFIFRFISMC